MTIVEQYTTAFDFPAGIAIIVLVFVLSMLLIVYGVFEREKDGHPCFGLWLIVMGILCFIFAVQLWIAWPQVNRYKVAWDSDTTIQSITEQYTIIRQDGDYLILEDKHDFNKKGTTEP